MDEKKVDLFYITSDYQSNKVEKIKKEDRKNNYISPFEGIFSSYARRSLPGKNAEASVNKRKGFYPLAFLWSARNFARPISVSGWFRRPSMASSGQVTTWAPFSAALTICNGFLMEAASIWVS
jgi:hypothetical protein